MKSGASSADDVCAIIVSHDAGSRIERVVQSLAPQVGHIVVVDNASADEDRRVLQGLSSAWPEMLTLILNAENLWMAAALNQGVEWADEHGYAYVLFSSDADTLSPHAVATMLPMFTDLSLGRVGSVNPRVVLGTPPAEAPISEAPTELELPVTGGCLVAMEAIRAVGPQREEFLVDMVDYDFGFRMHKAGYRTLQAPAASVAGELGRTTSRRFLWRTCSVHNYSPVRRYYFARNGLTLIRESRNGPLSRFYWRFLIASIAKILLYESDKVRKLRMIGRGLGDSVRGQLGPYQA